MMTTNRVSDPLPPPTIILTRRFLLALLIFALVLTAVASWVGYTLAVAKIEAETPASAELVVRWQARLQEQKAALSPGVGCHPSMATARIRSVANAPGMAASIWQAKTAVTLLRWPRALLLGPANVVAMAIWWKSPMAMIWLPATPMLKP